MKKQFTQGFGLLAIMATAIVLSVACRRNDMHQGEQSIKTMSIQSEVLPYGAQSPSGVVSKSGEAELGRISGVWGAADSTLGTWGTTRQDNVVSKATAISWEKGDVMGAYFHTSNPISESNIKPGCGNAPYTAVSPTEWISETFMAPPFTGLFVTAYYPHKVAVSSPLAVAHTVRANQSEKANYTLSDLMTTEAASPVDAADVNNVNAKLSFAHRFAQFVVTFEVPSIIDGRKGVYVNRITFTDLLSSATINLTTNTMSTSSKPVNITPYAQMAGTGGGVVARYEAIVAPQTLLKGRKLVEIVFSTEGGDKPITYNVPNLPTDQDLVFAPGGSYELKLEPSGALAFLTQGDFSDGLAKIEPIQVKVYKGRPWSLTTSEPWCELSFDKTDGFGSALARTATQNDGQELTVYVKVLGNNTPRSGNWAARTSILTLKNTATSALVMMPLVQGYNRWEASAAPLVLAAGEQSVDVAFASNKPWHVSIAPTTFVQLNWLDGTAGVRYPISGQHLGSLLAEKKLRYELVVNNTDFDREVVASYMQSNREGGEDIETERRDQLIKQLKPAITDFTHAFKSMTIPAGVYASTSLALAVTPAKNLQWKLVSNTPDKLTVSPTGVQNAKVEDVALLSTVNNGGAARELRYSMHYGTLSGVLKTDYVLTQKAPDLIIGPVTSKAVGPHVSSDSFLLTTLDNHSEVEYLLTKSALVTSIVPMAGAVQTINTTDPFYQRVDMAFGINNGATKTHKIDLTYGGGAFKKSYTVTQEAPSLALDRYAATIGPDGGTIQVTLNANMPYTWKMITPYNCSLTPADGTAPPYKDRVLTITIPAQPVGPTAGRDHTFVFIPLVDKTDDSQQRTLTVTQTIRNPFVTLSSSGASGVSDAGGTYYTTVTSNTPWSTSTSSGISCYPSSGSAGSTSVRIDVSGHTDINYITRSANFTTYGHSGYSSETKNYSARVNPHYFLHVWWGNSWPAGKVIDYWGIFIWSNPKCKIRTTYYNSLTNQHLIRTDDSGPAHNRPVHLRIGDKGGNSNFRSVELIHNGNVVQSVSCWNQQGVTFSRNCRNCWSDHTSELGIRTDYSPNAAAYSSSMAKYMILIQL